MSADLIAKLERATGRDPELNRAIDEFDVRSRGKLAPDKPFCVEVSPDFTGALDAALTLVPEGCNWDVSGGDPTHCYATIWISGVTTPNALYQISGRTSALALCIAALKARVELSVAA